MLTVRLRVSGEVIESMFVGQHSVAAEAEVLLMAPFTTHAMMRFVERYVARMPARPRPLQQDFERFVLAARTAHFAWCGWRFPVIGSVAGSNYAQAQLVNREEAEALVAGKFPRQAKPLL